VESNPKKSPRSNLIVSSLVLSCVSFAYGFSNQSALFQWAIPLAIPLLAAAWAYRPRRTPQPERSGNA
jgi:hypothetical protein